MIQWVLDALSGAKHVDNVIIVGLSPKNKLKSKKPVYYLSNQGRMLSNIVAGVAKSVELDKNSQYVMVASTDIPTLKPEMVDWLVETSMKTKDDIYYGVCTNTAMEKRFPGSKRTYTKLKDMQLCGADINIAHVSMTTDHLDMWETLIGSRKNPFKQAWTIGLGTLWQVLTRSITLDDLVVKVSERIGIKGRAIIWPYAEACMDVDKPHQLELLREDIAKQQKKAAAKKKRAKSVKAKTSAAVKNKPVASVKAKSTKTVKAAAKPKSKTTKTVKTEAKPKPETTKTVKTNAKSNSKTTKTKPKAKPKKK
jgi:hypothetical protein